MLDRNPARRPEFWKWRVDRWHHRSVGRLKEQSGEITPGILEANLAMVPGFLVALLFSPRLGIGLAVAGAVIALVVCLRRDFLEERDMKRSQEASKGQNRD